MKKLIIQLFAIILVANLFSPAAWGKTSQLEKKSKLLLSLDGNYKGGVELTTLSSKMVFGYDRSSENYDMKISSCKAYCAGLFGQAVMVEDPNTGVREEQTRVVYAVGNQNLKDGPLDGDKSTGTGYKPENRNLPKSGTYYMITPQYDGHICAFVIFNSGKPFYVCKGSTGECLPVGALTLKADGNEPTNVSLNDDFTVDDKFTGTVEFDVTGGETYYLFGTGTKLSFGGYTYTYVLDHEDEIITFADEQVKAICVANWDLGGDGELSKMEAAKVTDLWGFQKKPITSFDELQYFVGLTIIGDHAFNGCTGLTSITIPNSVTTIGSGAFSVCTGLTSITIPNSVTTIGKDAFSECTGLTSITIPNSVTTIGEFAFSGCTGLTSITIPNSVTTIGTGAFSGCTGLTSITIPNSVTSIGSNPFAYCYGLASLTVSSENIVYDSRNNCNAIIETASNTLISGCKNTIIPNSVASIGVCAFSGYTGLTTITIPNSVTTIGDGAFINCTGLSSINIPNSVTSIDEYAFSGCTGLTSITIPNSVTTIGWGAFCRCTSLKSISIPNHVTEIETSTFSGCTSLTSVIIPDNVTLIGSDAFRDCTSLNRVTISEGVTTVHAYAFRDCTKLRYVSIPSSLTDFGEEIFYGCNELEDVVNYATTPQSIPSNTFTKYSNLHVLPGCGDAYRYSQDWYMFTIVEDAVDANGMICPDDNHPHMIDLGLPSGTKWACCNVDTKHPENQSPTNYGGYYAWGETNTKSIYSWSSYTHCDGSSSTCHNLGSDIAGTQYDVAHVKWGGSWVMPSKEQQDELINNCTSTWTTQNGVSGRLFTGTNGCSIFLPAAGDRYGSRLLNAGSDGYYWSSTQRPSYANYAYILDFYSGSTYTFYNYRSLGFTVRPVIDEITSTNLPKTPSVITNNAVYNLFGIKVADSISGTSILRPGIYIVNGKKKVIK